MKTTLAKTLFSICFLAYAGAFGAACVVHDRGPDRTVVVDHDHGHDHDHDRDYHR